MTKKDILDTWVSQFPCLQTCIVSKITLSMFKAQGSQNEPKSKGIINNFGYKGVYTLDQMSKFYYFEYVTW